MNRHVVLGGSGVTNRHVVLGDRSVTFWHQESKEWILNDVNILNLMNLFPKWVWYGGLCPHGCTWLYYQWFLYLLMLPVEYCSWFYDIIWYILLSILSWPMISTQYLCFVLTPTCMFSFVNCGVQQTYRRFQLNRNSSQSSSYQVSGWANTSSLDWIFF